MGNNKKFARGESLLSQKSGGNKSSSENPGKVVVASMKASLISEPKSVCRKNPTTGAGE